MNRLVIPLLISAACLLATKRLPCAESWPDQRSAGPFLCHADFSLSGYESLLSEMSTLQQDLCGTLGIQPTQEQIHLFWFQRKATYQSYVNYYFPAVPTRRALFIKQRGPGMVFAYRHSDFATDVRHESTHALLHGALPMVPLWLDEGLAEYFEMPAEQRAHENPHQTSVAWRVRLARVPSLERLEEIDQLSDMGRGEYRDSWAWVHFMLHGPSEAHQELVAYLRDVQAHTPPGRLSTRLRRRIPDLDRRFAEHFKNW